MTAILSRHHHLLSLYRFIENHAYHNNIVAESIEVEGTIPVVTIQTMHQKHKANQRRLQVSEVIDIKQQKHTRHHQQQNRKGEEWLNLRGNGVYEKRREYE